MNVLRWDSLIMNIISTDRVKRSQVFYCMLCYLLVCVTIVQGRRENIRVVTTDRQPSTSELRKETTEQDIQDIYTRYQTTIPGPGDTEHHIDQHLDQHLQHGVDHQHDHDHDHEHEHDHQHGDELEQVHEDAASTTVTYSPLSESSSLAAVDDSLDLLASDLKTAFGEFFGSGDHDDLDSDHGEHHVDHHDDHQHHHHSDHEVFDVEHGHNAGSHQHDKPNSTFHSSGGSSIVPTAEEDVNVSDRTLSTNKDMTEETAKRYIGWLNNRKVGEGSEKADIRDGQHDHSQHDHGNHEHDEHGDHLHDERDDHLHDDHDDHLHDGHDDHLHDDHLHDEHNEHKHDGHDEYDEHVDTEHDEHAHDEHAHDYGHGHGHSHEGHHHGKGRSVSELSVSVWLVSSASILVISLIGVFSVGFLPLLSDKRGEAILQGFICIAVGTLIGDSFIHLAPHALTNGHSTESTWKGFLASIVVIGFITLDKVLSYVGVKQNHSHASTAFTPIFRTEQDKLSVDRGFEDSFSQTSTVLADECGSMSSASILQEGSSENGQHPGHVRRSNTNLMVIIGDAVHNFADGIAIGAAFSIGYGPGISTSIAVLCHELPHEIGDFAILIQNGMRIRTALMYNLVSSITGFLGMCLGLVLGSSGEYSTWMIAGIMGVFLYVALVSMLPEISADSKKTICINISSMVAGVLLLLVIGLYEDSLVNFLAF